MKSDKQLRQDVLCELDREPAAGAAAQRASGVGALALDLTVEPPAIARRADADIARAAGNLLLWLAGVPRGAVLVEVEHGHVTLSGQLEWTYQRHAATEAVRDMKGVVGVTNLIAIKARVPAAVVAVDIEAAL